MALGVLAYALGRTSTTVISFVILAGFLALLAFRKRLLWHVRNRLLLTFFLFGVVPVSLIGLMLVLSIELALGNLVVQRVRQGLDMQEHAGLPLPLNDETIKSVTDGAVTLAAAIPQDEDPDIQFRGGEKYRLR